jgi:hypothetical protein
LSLVSSKSKLKREKRELPKLEDVITLDSEEDAIKTEPRAAELEMPTIEMQRVEIPSIPVKPAEMNTTESVPTKSLENT